MIPLAVLERTAEELMAKAAIEIPDDYLAGIRRAADSESGDLSVMVRDAAGEDSLVATIEAYADHPESLAAIEINGRSVALPDLVQGADLMPRSDAPEDPAPLGPRQDDGSLVLEVEQADGGAVDSIVIPPADQAALAAPGQTAEDDSQSDGL